MALTMSEATDRILQAHRIDPDKTRELRMCVGGLAELVSAVMEERVTLPAETPKPSEWKIDVSNESVEKALVHVDRLMMDVRAGVDVEATARGFLFMVLSDMRVDK